jgi:ubiquinone/menaquinone biosynthesis C-methylase UbiE
MDGRLTKWQAAYIENAYRELETGVTRKQIEELGLNVRDKAFLDVGCGPGNFLVGVSADGPERMVGVDLDEQFLAVARRELKRRSVSNFTLIKATATDLPFVNESWDVLTCFLVLPHVPDDKDALAELARVLKKGGILAISGHGSGFPLRYLKRLRFKPLLMYLWSLVYAVTGKKLIRNTLQNYKKVCQDLARMGFVVDQVTLLRKSLGLVGTYRIKAIKGN